MGVRGGGASVVAAASLANQQSPRHQNPIKKNQGYETQLCTHPMPSVVVEGAQQALRQSLACGNGKATGANVQPQLVE